MKDAPKTQASDDGSERMLRLETKAMTAFLGEAMTEGEALGDLIEYYATEGSSAIEAAGHIFRSGGFRRVAFAGMGSSYCAPLAVTDYLIGNGIPSIALNAHKVHQDRARLVTSDTLVIAISKSGATRELLNLAHGIGAHAGLIALVNEPESALADRGKVLLPMKAGSETQIASKSFLCTLAVLNLLAMELTGTPQRERLGLLRDIAQWIRTYLAAASRNTAPLLAIIDGCTHIDLLACGASFSTAYKSALVLREVPKVMAAAVDAADYAHGWAKAIRRGYVGIVLAPEYSDASIEARAVQQILDRGGKVILMTGSPVEPQKNGLTVARHPQLPERLAPLAQVAMCDAMIGAMTNASH